ncbi:MAG: YceI family protein [Phycisphaeraceae bacterium]|nr:YceI family protein [Phycisphaeraceae bacterium]
MRTRTFVALPVALLLAAGALGFAAHERSTPAPAIESATVEAAAYAVDSVHSSVVFRIKHAGIANFYGRFNGLSGEFTFDPENPSAGQFAFSVKTQNVDTGNSQRDDHLRNADFFNAVQFPSIDFKSTSITHVEGNHYVLKGDLSLHGKTRPVEAKFEWLGTGTFRNRPIAAFEAVIEIKRSDFDMTHFMAPDGSDSGGLGNNVTIKVAVEAAQK